ncbi:MAG: hypothetical protein ABW009_06630 [Acidimicrobiales bacterium]
MATIQAPRRDPEPDGQAPEAPEVRRREVTLAGLTGLVVTVAGLLIGLQRLQDNSFFTHLATGRLILDAGVPSADPYSFTAHGAAWTVQSWLASVVYALVEDVAGLAGVRLLIGLGTALLAYLLWRLTEPAGAVVARAALVMPAMVIGSVVWTERPMLYGFVGLAIVALLANGDGKAWWCVPLFAVWVNVHGSFPLGLVLIGTLLVGRWLDRQSPRRELQVLGWSVLGVLLGGINPIGPRLLVFPLELLQKSEVLSYIEEWKPADFSDTTTRVLVVQVAVAVILGLRLRSFRALLPTAVFFVAALLGSRNIGPASIVTLACMTPGLRGFGRDLGNEPKPVFRTAALVVGALAVVATLGTLLAGPQTALDSYPTDAVAWMAAHGYMEPESRVITPDFVGNYLEARYGTDVQVFMDDRYDMFPRRVVDDYIDLVRGNGEWTEIAARWDADAVLWNEGTDLYDRLEAAENWDVVYRDDTWIVAVPS